MKTSLKNIAIALCVMALIAVVIRFISLTTTLTIIVILQLIVLLALGGTNVHIKNITHHEQKSQTETYHGEEEA